MQVANHALAGRNGAREDVLNGMAGLVFWNGGIDGGGVAEISVCGVRRGVQRIAVICVDDVAGGAAAGAIVAGMIVRAGQRHDGVHKTRFLQTEKDGIGAKFGAETAVA